MSKKKLIYGTSRSVPKIRDELHLLSWIERGKLRKQVFLKITDKMMPSKLVEELSGKRKSASEYVQVSRALKELESQGLVKCLTPKEKTGRFYILTDKGKELRKEF